jgi:hypothetical protein
VNRIAKVSSLLGLLLVGVAVQAAAVPGKWVGRLDFKFTPPQNVKPPLTPDQLKGINESLSGIRVTLAIKADGTYTAVTTYAATTPGPKRPPQSSKGKWKLKGKTLTLSPDDKRPPEIGTLGADGKTMTVSLPKDMTARGVTGKAVFKKS